MFSYFGQLCAKVAYISLIIVLKNIQNACTMVPRGPKNKGVHRMSGVESVNNVTSMEMDEF